MKDINFPKNLIIAGQFCHGQWDLSGNRNGIFSPYNLQKIGELITPSAQQIQAVISSAQSAFEKWRQTPLKNRTQILFNFRHILMRDLDKISPVIALESGKLISEAQAGLLKGIEVLEFALSLQNIEQGGKLEVSRGVYCEFRRKPLGIVASITPFNFPAMVPLWTIPIALVLGNTFIWKPSDKTPLTSVLLADALAEAGIPAGVFSVLQGNKETVDALIAHPQVKAISFVGSSKIAKLVYQNAAQNGKRVLALGGAKNHLFLLPDADPKLTHKGIADSFTGCAGQRCMAASVLLSIGDNQKHIDGIVAQVKKN
jgi:malonate-semialdehyde dehydrogenase (acetylating)/methylmalonate-semialdehyde dehydrogenase